jgi:hypothetical protein
MRRRDRGFSLLEAVIATALTLAVVAGVFAMIHPAQGAFAAQPEVADMQQRLRVAVDTLTRDLTMAGTGAYIGGHAGPLIHYFPPVLPFRQGESGDDAVGTFRTDTITIISVPTTSAQTTLGADLMPAQLTLQAAVEPGCPVGTNLCGFTAGQPSSYTTTPATSTRLRSRRSRLAAQLTLTARRRLVHHDLQGRIESRRARVHALKTDIASQTFQLMHTTVRQRRRRSSITSWDSRSTTAGAGASLTWPVTRPWTAPPAPGCRPPRTRPARTVRSRSTSQRPPGVACRR